MTEIQNIWNFGNWNLEFVSISRLGFIIRGIRIHSYICIILYFSVKEQRVKYAERENGN